MCTIQKKVANSCSNTQNVTYGANISNHGCEGRRILRPNLTGSGQVPCPNYRSPQAFDRAWEQPRFFDTILLLGQLGNPALPLACSLSFHSFSFHKLCNAHFARHFPAGNGSVAFTPNFSAGSAKSPLPAISRPRYSVLSKMRPSTRVAIEVA